MTIRTKPATPEYRENFDRVFGKKEKCAICYGRNKPSFRGEPLKSCPVCGRRFDVETSK